MPILYDIGKSNGDRYIHCHQCGRRSFNRFDIANHYCGACHVFLDDVLDARDDHLRKQIADLRRLVTRDETEEGEEPT
jgi:hypothetical protein